MTFGTRTTYPSGADRPNTSNLNWAQGQTIANSTIVGLAAGELDLYVNNSAADVIVDVSGYVL
jgi:hypothetical protein